MKNPKEKEKDICCDCECHRDPPKHRRPKYETVSWTKTASDKDRDLQPRF